MSTNIFKSKRNELVAVIREALSQGLPPLFRVQRELLRKAGPDSSEVTCDLKELAVRLGYSVHELETFLKDLSILDFIKYQAGDKDSDKWRMKILVR